MAIPWRSCAVSAAALVSAYLHAAAGAIQVLIDGFIASVAALLAVGVQAAVGE